ncbi:hypothetical protein G6F57_015204 [Rhizopus arrhizus]|nr:hypothetical protein G6F35_013414 [Rhizopus arrhizus]KAG1455921.1 hypothetical protein G6F57_015204 [Rhizopus arrhizus]
MRASRANPVHRPPSAGPCGPRRRAPAAPAGAATGPAASPRPHAGTGASPAARSGTRRGRTPPVQLHAGRRGIRAQQRHAAVTAAASGQRIQQGAVVRPMAVGLHHHGPLHAQMGVQRCHLRVRRIGRRIRPTLGVRKHVARSEDVAMRVAGARRQGVARAGG